MIGGKTARILYVKYAEYKISFNHKMLSQEHFKISWRPAGSGPAEFGQAGSNMESKTILDTSILYLVLLLLDLLVISSTLQKS